MNKQNYKNKFQHNESLVIAIDFDGVVHNHDKGYHDGTIYGNPIKGALESIKYLKNKGYLIKIYTCKSHPDRPLVNGKTGTQLVLEWFEKNKMETYIEEVVWGKPHALVYIDDKGYRFRNWEDTIKFLDKTL